MHCCRAAVHQVDGLATPLRPAESAPPPLGACLPHDNCRCPDGAPPAADGALNARQAAREGSGGAGMQQERILIDFDGSSSGADSDGTVGGGPRPRHPAALRPQSSAPSAMLAGAAGAGAGGRTRMQAIPTWNAPPPPPLYTHTMPWHPARLTQAAARHPPTQGEAPTQQQQRVRVRVQAPPPSPPICSVPFRACA